MLNNVALADMRTTPEKQVIHLVDKIKTSVGIGNQTVQLEELLEILKTSMEWKVSATNEIKA